MVGGLLASVGQRLIGSAAEKIVNQLFEGLRQELER
jgi:carbon monoxide dehydrogenase subunit G